MKPRRALAPTGQPPTPGASNSPRTSRAPTPHPSPGEIAAHSGSQAALSGAPWAESPNRTRPGQTADTSLLGAHGPLTPEEAPQ